VGLKKIPGRYVGIRKDGTLVATSYVNNGEKFAQGHGDDRWDEIRTWTDIVQFERLGQRIVGLDAYGDLYATSKFIPDEPEDGVVDIWEKIHSWHGLVFLNSWLNYVVGLTVDGTVVSAKWFKEAGKEKEDYGQADLNGWKNVAYLVLSWKKTLGVRQDGTLMIAGDFDKEHGADQVGHIRLFRDFNTLAQNRAKKAQEASYKAYLEDVDRKRKEAYESRKLAAAEVYLQEKKRLQAEAEKEIDNNLQHKADLSSRCNALEIRRAGLGLFKGKEKAALSEQISQLDQQIRLIPTEDAVRSKYRPKIAEQETLAKQTLDSLKKTIENEFPKMSMEEFMQQ